MHGSKTTVITMKLTQAELDALELIVAERDFHSRSAALRSALAMLFEYYKVDRATNAAIDHQRKTHRPRRVFNLRRLRNVTTSKRKK